MKNIEEKVLDLKLAMLDLEMRMKTAEELLKKQIIINEGLYNALKAIQEAFKG